LRVGVFEGIAGVTERSASHFRAHTNMIEQFKLLISDAEGDGDAF